MPFADALTPLLARLRARYAQTPLPQFLHWWGAELRSCLPLSWQRLLAAQDAQVWLRLGNDALRIERSSARDVELLAERSIGEPPMTPAELEQLLGEQGLRAPRIVLLPAGSLLVRRLSLPVVAAANARSLMGFEIDRQTPFRADQVEYDCRLLPPEPGSKLAAVDLAVIPREAMQRWMQPLSALVGHLDAVDLAQAEGRAGYNLLPVTARRAHDHKPWLINLGIVAASALMLLLAMVQLVDNRVLAVEGLQAEVEQQREQARATAKLRKSLDDAAAAANFLAEQKAQRPSMIELLRVLTELLPDDTFVERMSYSGDTLSISVQSGSAAKLVELLQSSQQLRNPALAGPIMPDPRSGKDRVTLTAQFGPAPAKEGK